MLSCESDGNQIIIRGRDDNRDRYENKITYKPYFYIPNKNGQYISLYGDKLSCIECDDQYDLYAKRKKHNVTYESDVPHATRYLIDNHTEIKKEPIRVCFFDIETEDRDGFPDIKKADKPILSIAFYDNFTDKYTILVTSPNNKEVVEERTYNVDEADITVNYIECKKESQMLKTFIDLIVVLDFDIFYAWNGGTLNWQQEGGFDYPMLFNRIKRLKLPIDSISPINTIDKRSGFPKGRAFLDLMKAHRKLSTQELESYALDAVGNAELGIRKVYHEERIGDMWENDIDKFVKYNLKDVYIMVKIEEKKGITDYFDTIRRTTFCSWDDLLWNSKVLDNYALKYAKKLGIVLPNKNKGSDDEESIQGARVLTPIVGIHKGCAVVDVQSLYPSAILTCNMSPETIIDEYYAKENNIEYCKVDDICFRIDKRGFIPLLVEELWNLRQSYKKLRNTFPQHSDEYNIYDIIQTVCKFLLNSLYGVLLLKIFRLYNRDVGKSVTFFGREYNKFMENVIVESGHKPVYGDTDSCCFKLHESTFNSRIKEAKKLTKKLNDISDEWCKETWGSSKYNKLYLEFEQIYQTLITLPARDGTEAKKRYFGLVYYKDGVDLRNDPEMCIKGISSKRSDTPNLLRTFQKDIFKLVLLGRDEEAKEKVKQMYFDITNNKFTPEELAIPKGMSKAVNEYDGTLPIHIRGIRYYNMYCGGNVKREKIKYIYVHPNIHPKGAPQTNVISFTDKFPEEFKPDFVTMADKLLIYQYDTLFRVMGWSIDELRGQCSLSCWM